MNYTDSGSDCKPFRLLAFLSRFFLKLSTTQMMGVKTFGRPTTLALVPTRELNTGS